jgi:hypothetical protein
MASYQTCVAPAKAEAHPAAIAMAVTWIPAFAGMTSSGCDIVALCVYT